MVRVRVNPTPNFNPDPDPDLDLDPDPNSNPNPNPNPSFAIPILHYGVENSTPLACRCNDFLMLRRVRNCRRYYYCYYYWPLKSYRKSVIQPDASTSVKSGSYNTTTT